MDSYERRARLTPGLFAVAPVVALVVTLGLQKNALVSAFLGAVSIGVGAYLLSVVVASLGRRLQDQLWEKWGGAPAIQLLRARSTHSTAAQREIWRDAIQKVTGVKLLSRSRESVRAEEADDLISAAIGQVRRLGQDPRYPLVAFENAQYGLERNLFGSRWLGRISALACAIGSIVALLWISPPSITVLVGVVVEVTLSVLWFIIPSEARMKNAAFRYSEQLLQAVVGESKGSSK